MSWLTSFSPETQRKDALEWRCPTEKQAEQEASSQEKGQGVPMLVSRTTAPLNGLVQSKRTLGLIWRANEMKREEN
jgi:hypothetical protein